jgi:hypothetical protein
MSRRSLRGIHTTIARKQAQGVQSSFTPRVDLPVTLMTDQQLNAAGWGLLPEPEPVETPTCIYCGVACFMSAPLPYCSTSCAINAAADNQEDR